MKTISIPTGFITIAESKAVCPHCERDIPFDELDTKWAKQNNQFIKIKCKTCKEMIGIALEMRGDFIAFDLNEKK